METIEKQSEVLNDLIRINHDRIEGYEKAAKEAEKHPDLVSLFLGYANDSKGYATALKAHCMDGDVDTTASGKIYRVWMDMKTAINDSRKSVLDLCEFGEDAALKAYNDAVDEIDELSPEVGMLVRNQRSEIQSAHDRIKILRDTAA